MATRVKHETLHRYTSLPALIHLLQTKSITLLSPEFWDDSNDRHLIDLYRERRDLHAVLAVCFTKAPETFHHWRVFTHGSEGVCIHFSPRRLAERFAGVDGIAARDVRYERISDIRNSFPRIDDLPFTKRFPYRDEREHRIIYSSADEELDTKCFPLELSSIRRVVLSPWLPRALLPSVRDTLRAIPGCAKLPIHATTLIANEAWKEWADNAEE